MFNFNFSEKPFIKKDARYVDYVTLDFKCSFPLSLVLNKRAIAKYQCLFRHMFWFKFIERQLNLCWVKLQNTNESNVECFRVAYITNNRVIHFVKSLIYYLSEEVIEMNWIKLTQELGKANNFEQIIQAHERFLNNCLKESLLTNQVLLQILASEIGNTIQSYFRIKEYLSDFEAELNAFKVIPFRCRRTNRPRCMSGGSTSVQCKNRLPTSWNRRNSWNLSVLSNQLSISS